MKKFSFSLAKLKHYKERILEAEKNNLGIFRRELEVLRQELEDIFGEIEAKNQELGQKMKTGTTPLEISVRKRFINARQQDAALKQIDIVHKEDEVQKQLDLVLELTKEVNSLEKLEEGQLEEYRAAEQKETEQFIEEFMSNADFRKTKM